jgi:hypothetical protein
MKEQNELIDKGKIIASFQDGGVMTKFEELSKENQEAILKEILSRDSQEKQIDLIVKHIEKLS